MAFYITIIVLYEGFPCKDSEDIPGGAEDDEQTMA
jgi:hypothetical protein